MTKKNDLEVLTEAFLLLLKRKYSNSPSELLDEIHNLLDKENDSKLSIRTLRRLEEEIEKIGNYGLLSKVWLKLSSLYEEKKDYKMTAQYYEKLADYYEKHFKTPDFEDLGKECSENYRRKVIDLKKSQNL